VDPMRTKSGTNATSGGLSAVVRTFLLNLHRLTDAQVWTELEKAADAPSYGKAIQQVLRFAEQRGFHITQAGWEAYVRTTLANLPGELDNQIRMLRDPPEQHSESLREWVHEVCDHEGESGLTEEEDYECRVQYVLEALHRENARPSLFSLCSQAQLRGRGWLPCRLGSFCKSKSRSNRILLNWDQILHCPSRPVSDPDEAVITQVKCDHCALVIPLPAFSSEISAAVAASVRSVGPQVQHLMEAIQILRTSSPLGLRECRVIAEHVTLSKGLCHTCQSQLRSAGTVVCRNCRAVNLDW
jgi:hypothetical protein